MRIISGQISYLHFIDKHTQGLNYNSEKYKTDSPSPLFVRFCAWKELFKKLGQEASVQDKYSRVCPFSITGLCLVC
jgi:hypothetical protein